MRNLVICCAGDDSLHPQWNGAEPDFDLMIIYYGDQEGMFRDQAKYYLHDKGSKWQLMCKALEKFGDEFSTYENIWLPDDDIATDVETVNKMFSVFSSNGFALAQPALEKGSYVSHTITSRNIETNFRKTNFVEVMMPLFSRELFKRLLTTFSESVSGWGLDYLWPAIIEREKLGCMAILDNCAMLHTRPQNLQGSFYRKLTNRPQDDLLKLSKQYNLSHKKIELEWNAIEEPCNSN